MWKNFDWDGDFLIEMMVKKMKDMRYQFDVVDSVFIDLRHQPLTHNEGDERTQDCLEELDKAIALGEKILEHDYIQYTPNIQKHIDSCCGLFLPASFSPELRKELNDVYKKADEEEQKDRMEFFNIIRDNHQKWWD